MMIGPGMPHDMRAALPGGMRGVFCCPTYMTFSPPDIRDRFLPPDICGRFLLPAMRGALPPGICGYFFLHRHVWRYTAPSIYGRFFPPGHMRSLPPIGNTRSLHICKIRKKAGILENLLNI